MAIPLKVVLHHFPSRVNSRSTPAVVTLLPGRVIVTEPDGTVLDAPASSLQIKRGRVTGVLTLTGPDTKLLMAAYGGTDGKSTTEEQIREVEQNQAVADRDPDMANIELAHFVWLGDKTVANGSRASALKSVQRNEAGNQYRVARMVYDAMLIAGVQPG